MKTKVKEKPKAVKVKKVKEELPARIPTFKCSLETLNESLKKHIPKEFIPHYPSNLELSSNDIPYKFTIGKSTYTGRVYSLEQIYIDIYWNESTRKKVDPSQNLKVFVY